MNGEYGAATACGGALEPFAPFGGSLCPGQRRCSSCNLSKGSPTMSYLAQFTGGHRMIFWGCGIAAKSNLVDASFSDGEGTGPESLRAFPTPSSLSAPLPLSAGLDMSDSVADKTSTEDGAGLARCSWSERTKP